MSEALSTVKTLLRELFQFGCTGLDFGIYRSARSPRNRRFSHTAASITAPRVREGVIHV
jgi:hypothetical protein